MCISATMLTAIATTFQVVSAISGGMQQSAQAEWQADQARADAQAAKEAGQVRADRIRKAGRYQQSEARAALAGSGVEVDAGTPVRIVQQIGRDAEGDAQTELLSGISSAARLTSEASAYDISAKNARTNSYLRAGGSLLQGGSKIAKGWNTYPAANNPDEWY